MEELPIKRGLILDAGKFFALLRFEEASLVLRAALKLGVIDELEDQLVSLQQLQERFGFTAQATRTFVAILEVMEILERCDQSFRVPIQARQTLANGLPTSRRSYLAMGMGEEVNDFIRLLRGDLPDGSLPLYGAGDAKETVMDLPDVAEAIAYGLSSRARNFSEPLAAAIQPMAKNARVFADIGAGSPFVADACSKAMPHLGRLILVDQTNGMKFARKMVEQLDGDVSKLEFSEQDFFESVPIADVYCLSNTAHDWLPDEYAKLMKNIRDSITPNGVVCIHEPLLMSQWQSSEQWIHALWMACYAITLFRLTEGKGTCYTRSEHDIVMRQSGFEPVGEPVLTSDGCTALFYQVADSAFHDIS